MRAYSLDLRERIVRACDAWGFTRAEVAEDFSVSRSFVQKLLQRHRGGDPLAPKSWDRGPAPRLDEKDCQRLRDRVRACPDATLAELCAWLEEKGGPGVSRATMCRALQALELPLKKSRSSRRSGTRRACSNSARSGGGRCGRST
jgi:transposase